MASLATCLVALRCNEHFRGSGVAWVFVARGADCQWGPPNFADYLFLQGRI